MLVEIKYTLEFTAPFHCGTGISTNLLDRTVVRDANKHLYIPASTIKGVVREHCEHLLRFYIPAQQGKVASPHDASAALNDFGGPSTLVSGIFGSQIHPGGLLFDNAKLEQEDWKMYEYMQTSVLTQVRIDRVTRTAVNEALYTSEFGSRFLSFRGIIKGQLDCTSIDDLAKQMTDDKGEADRIVPCYSLLLLLTGLLMTEQLGGNKSTGKGQCRCIIDELLIDKDTCLETDWQSWIAKLDKLSNYTPVKKGEQR